MGEFEVDVQQGTHKCKFLPYLPPVEEYFCHCRLMALCCRARISAWLVVLARLEEGAIEVMRARVIYCDWLRDAVIE